MKRKMSKAEWLAVFGEWAKRGVTVSGGPAYLTLLTTGRCNLSCFMCFHSLIKEVPVSINPSRLEPFLARAKRVFLAGGEPLWMSDAVNVRAKEVFASLVENHPHAKVNAYTNGVLLDDRMLDLVMAHFESIHFSVDSVDPAVYSMVRGKPLLATVLGNMERLAAKKRAKGLKPSDFPHINMNTIVMRSTVRGLPDVAETLARLEGNKHVLVRLRDDVGHDHGGMVERMIQLNALADSPSNREQASRMVAANHARIAEELIHRGMGDEEEHSAIFDRLRRIHSAAGIAVEDQGNFLKRSTEKPSPPGLAQVCPAPWVTADIGEGGAVTCCCGNKEPLGNVNDDPFEEIWNGPRIRALREAFIRGEMMGCNPRGCPASYDYFQVGKGAFSPPLLENLRRIAGGADSPASILLLNTAPDHQAKLAVRTFLKAFPRSRLTVVACANGRSGPDTWGMEDVNVRIFPHRFFSEAEFAPWWKREGGRHAWAVFLYNSEHRAGYEGVEGAVEGIAAERRLGITPGGALLHL